VVKTPPGKNAKTKSLSVIKTAENVNLKIKNEKNSVTLSSGLIVVDLNLQNGTVNFRNTSGKGLLKESTPPIFEDFNDAGNKALSVYQAFLLDSTESIYGLGQFQDGKMNQRHQTKQLVQGNLEDVIPFFLSVKGYGIFWDNYSPTTFTDNYTETSFKSEVGECADYYFMYGGNADGVVSNMRELTGKAPMFPLWTFGFWQSKERYKSQDEIVDVVKKYRELNIPLDGIIQDWQYWGNNYLWNAMEFLNPEFPKPKKMIDDIHAMNAHMIISIWSSFGPETLPYKELDKKGMLFNIVTWPMSGLDVWPPDMRYPSGVRVYDAYNPEARDIYWKYANKGIFSLGIDGWWMDSTEPDHMEVKREDWDTKTFLGSFRKVRNAYPLMTVGGVSDHQRATASDKRIFILTRSAFAGQQRYGANTWSGDVVSSWKALHHQITAGLNFTLCGIPYWNSDIGGFFLLEYPGKLNDADYRELYVRWLQFGTFCPMMRSHGTDAPREIYQFGKKGNNYYDAIEKYIHLRYALLPYIYSTSWDVTNRNSTPMRALVMDFPNDKRAIDRNDTYMFGKSILVAPVIEPMYSKVVVSGSDTTRAEDFTAIKYRALYLPAGTDWYDFWTGQKIAGGQSINKEAPLDIMPLYIKAGSILPWGPKVQYAEEKKWDNLEIRIYTGANGEFTLYEDEGDSYNYEKGQYSEVKFQWNDKQKILTISKRKGSFPGMLINRVFNILTVSPGKGSGQTLSEKHDKSVSYTGDVLKIKL
jgi:alpha-D-xyloside xylohydrolase